MINDIKILSFSSPKGGVGRTLTLTNCARIYSKGVEWAGIEKSSVVMADFDFYAPGIHYYNFADTEDQKLYYAFGREMNYRQVVQLLDSQEVGLLFYLSSIIENQNYKKLCHRIISKYNKSKNNGDILKEYQEETLAILALDSFNPLHHVVQVPEKSIFILPAASPNHRNFDKKVFDFIWSNFINQYLGLDLLDCIFFALCEQVKCNQQPIRILLDQQGGSSIASAINKTLADSHILVGGFNEQNRSGLKSLLESQNANFKNIEPFIVLNQYNFRSLLDSHIGFEDSDKSPHQIFKEADQKRCLNYIEELKANPERIFITEFVRDAIQSEYFYLERDHSIDELTNLVIAVEKDFLKSSGLVSGKPALGKHSALKIKHDCLEKAIVILGEEVTMDMQFAGSLHGLVQLLKTHFPKCKIIGVAVSHKAIVDLAQNGKLCVNLIDKDDRTILNPLLRNLAQGIYKSQVSASGNLTLTTEAFDFISYPNHVRANFESDPKIASIPIGDFTAAASSTDTLVAVNGEYYTHHILNWEKYCLRNKRVIGVPMFLYFQLLTYNKKFFNKKSKLPFLFRKYANRNFEGFRNPQDILDFVNLARVKSNHLKMLSMFQSPDVFEFWYEWLTIFSIFYYGNELPEAISVFSKPSDVSLLKEFLLQDASIDAMMQYLKLAELCIDRSKQKDHKSDWNQTMNEFYDPLDEQSNGLMLIWPDIIPMQFREDDNYIYQVPPSFKIFEECWLLSAIKTSDENRISFESQLTFMNYYLSKGGQELYLKSGGLPVHKSLLTSLDSWRKYPFIPALCQIYLNVNQKEDMVENWQGISAVASKLYMLVLDMKKQTTTKESIKGAIESWN
jgi:hypothetical protein